MLSSSASWRERASDVGGAEAEAPLRDLLGLGAVLEVGERDAASGRSEAQRDLAPDADARPRDEDALPSQVGAHDLMLPGRSRQRPRGGRTAAASADYALRVRREGPPARRARAVREGSSGPLSAGPPRRVRCDHGRPRRRSDRPHRAAADQGRAGARSRRDRAGPRPARSSATSPAASAWSPGRPRRRHRERRRRRPGRRPGGAERGAPQERAARSTHSARSTSSAPCSGTGCAGSSSSPPAAPSPDVTRTCRGSSSGSSSRYCWAPPTTTCGAWRQASGRASWTGRSCASRERSTDGPARGVYRAEPGYSLPGGRRIARADVAEYMLDQLTLTDEIGHAVAVAY